jgi:hypothetical protein
VWLAFRRFNTTVGLNACAALRAISLALLLVSASPSALYRFFDRQLFPGQRREDFFLPSCIIIRTF